MTRAGWITLTISLLLIASAIGLFFTMFEKQSTTQSFGYSPEARLNDLLAVRRFLKRMGIPAENMATPSPASTLPPAADTILLATKRLTVDSRTQQLLQHWAISGGHLILTARSETVSDGLFDFFERYNEIETEGDRFLEMLHITTSEVDLSVEQRRESDSFGVAFPGVDDFIWVAFEPALRLQNSSHNFTSLSGDADGEFVVTGQYGQGRISVISDRRILHNRRIGDHDHARFLLELINLDDSTDKVWLIADDDMPGLYAWLWQHAQEAVITTALIILFILYKVAHRFGPIIDLEPATRRRLLEHIQASGWFLWRHQHYAQLLSGMQNNLKHQISVKHPGIREMGAASAAARLADFTDLTADEIRHVLGVIEVNSKDEFTTTVRLYERLRKQL